MAAGRVEQASGPGAPADGSPAEGRVLAGKYRVDRPIAEGGMGSVWAGQHLALDIPIAVKFMDARLLSERDSGWAQRFEREAKAAARLRHPQVVQVFDHGIEAGMPYIVMELLEGEDLGARMAKTGPMSLESAAWIMRQAARPLARAHELGIVHRDLKPGNLFVTRVGDEEMIKILDFGIAKAPLEHAAGESTKTGDVMGSPVYMSPEQANSVRDVDHRADLWALSVIIFRALTTELPYRGSVAQVLVQICTAGPPSARAYRPDLPEAVDAFFTKALARDPEQRYRSARELSAAFDDCAGLHIPSQPSLTPVPGVPLVPQGAEPTETVSEISNTLAHAKAVEVPAPRRSRALLWLGVAGGGAVLALAVHLGSATEPAADAQAEAAGPSEASVDASPARSAQPTAAPPPERSAKAAGPSSQPIMPPPLPSTAAPARAPAPRAPAKPPAPSSSRDPFWGLEVK